MSGVGVLSSSIFRLVTSHAKCDALLAAIAEWTPHAQTTECTTLPNNFATQEFQRHALPPSSADRRSLKGSYIVPLDALAALLRAPAAFWVRDTMQRSLLDAAATGRIASSFERASIVRDTSKRARALDSLEKSPQLVAEARAHWNSLRTLLVELEKAMVAEMPPMYIEVPPCACANCRKHVDPSANVRLLVFEFVGDVSIIDVVSTRRRKPLKKLAAKSSFSAAPTIDDNNDLLVPSPPPMMMSSTTTIAAPRSELEWAVAEATSAMRLRYEYKLAESRNEVMALRQHIDQLQRQMQSMQLSSAVLATVPAAAPAPPSFESMIEAAAAAATSTTTATANAMSELTTPEDFLSMSTLLARSPPRKRRHQAQCRDELTSSLLLFDAPPHSPTNTTELFAF